MNTPITLVIGCTASGKGKLGIELARRTGGEIISLDSMKVYRRMNIGTAKPSAETRAAVPYHMLDVVEPSEEFTVARYVDMTDQVIKGIENRGRPIFVVGGTPLYFKALTEGLFEGPGADSEIRDRLQRESHDKGLRSLHDRLAKLDPVAAARIHPNDRRRIIRALEVYELTDTPISELQAQWDRDRPRYDCTVIGLRREKEVESGRINERVRRMIEKGLVEEVSSLLSEPEPLSETARKAVGYAEIIEHLESRCSLAEAVEMIKINTRHLAKSQRTWFKRFVDTKWIELGPDADVSAVADRAMTLLEM